jgi:hypothetical protein
VKSLNVKPYPESKQVKIESSEKETDTGKHRERVKAAGATINNWKERLVSDQIPTKVLVKAATVIPSSQTECQLGRANMNEVM